MLWEPLCLGWCIVIYISNAVLVCCMLHFLDKVWCQVQVGVLGRLVACTTVLQRVSCVLHSHTSNRVYVDVVVEPRPYLHGHQRQ